MAEINGASGEAANWSRHGIAMVVPEWTAPNPFDRQPMCIVQLSCDTEPVTPPISARVMRIDPEKPSVGLAFGRLSPEAERFFDRLYHRRYQCEMAIHWIRFWSIKKHVYPIAISEEFELPKSLAEAVFRDSWKPDPAAVDRILAHMKTTLNGQRAVLRPEDLMADPAFQVRRVG